MKIQGWRLSKKLGSARDMARIKRWCRINNIPFGRLMNAVIKALADIDRFTYQELTAGSGLYPLTISIPKQVDLVDQMQYLLEKRANAKLSAGTGNPSS